MRLGYRVTGIDFSSVAVDWARNEARAAGMDIRRPVGPRHDSGQRWRAPLVVDANCLHCIVDHDARHAFLDNVRGALAPTGTFSVSARCERDGEAVVKMDGLPARRFCAPQLLIDELAEAGLMTAPG